MSAAATWQVDCFQASSALQAEVWCPATSTSLNHDIAAALSYIEAGEHLRSKVGDMGAQDIIFLGGFPQFIL